MTNQEKKGIVKKLNSARSISVKQTQEKLFLNFIQRQMYRKLMYGLNEYRPEQISKMSPKTITHIVKNHEKALKILHILKAKKLYKNETNLVNSIFPHAQIGNSDNDWLIKLPKDATLKKLGISTREIVDEFIQRKMLPIDFYNLSTDTVKL
jgi:hypothetical protein